MKSIKFASAIALAAGVLVMGSAQAADGGTIRIHGQVEDTTCSITGGAGTEGGTDTITVGLDKVAPAALTAAGTSGIGRKQFTLNIGAPGEGSCENGKIADLSFVTSSARIDAATGTLTNAAPFGAQNTNIQLTSATGAPYNLADPTVIVSSPEIAGNQTTITMGAQYYATGAATPGPVDTNVQYQVTYR